LAANLGGALAIIVGGSVAHIPELALLVTAAWIFFAGLAPLFGSAPAQISLLSSIMLVIAIGTMGWANALPQSGWWLVGGAWATALSLGVWSIHPNRPVREAVSKLYFTLSTLLQSGVGAPVQPKHESRWGTQSLSGFARELETARQVWAAVRTKNNGLSESEMQLLVAQENAQQSVRSTIAYLETLEVLAGDIPELRAVVLRLTAAFAATAQNLAVCILKRQRPAPPAAMEEELAALETVFNEQRAKSFVEPAQYRALASLGKFLRHASVLGGQFRRLTEVLGQAERIPLAPSTAISTATAELTNRPRFSHILLANLNTRSLPLRHACRVTLLTVVPQALGLLLSWPRAYWVPITVLIVLKADYGGTISRAIQRVIGTTLGGLIAAGLATQVQSVELQGVLIAVLAFFAFTVRPLNYSVFTIVLTPLFMVIVNLLHEGDWQVSLLRIGYTAMGGIICLAGGYLLLPDWERTRLPAQIAKAIRANLLYFQRVMDLYIQRSKVSVDIDHAQRVAELENANASAATQRLLAEPLHQRGDAESWMTVVVYLRGLTNSTTTLAEHAREISAGGALLGLGEIAAAIARALEDLAEMIEKDQQLSTPFQLDKEFTRLRVEVDRLHLARMQERATDPITSTPMANAVRENTFLSIELDQVINKVNVLRDAMERLKPITKS
ncbi:MAG: FUSC family protein, partial [Verrucomicrobia bacterium]|nr:FUSC family protein [Verrucomicrobiota bacterium]